MHLGKLYSNFDSRCNSYHQRIVDIKTKEPMLREWEFNYKTEVLISDIWQGWCHFTRELLMSSCRGTTARNGNIIPKRAGDNTWQRLGYEAKQAANQANASANGHVNFAIRKEPTWGDLDNISRIIGQLKPNNENYLVGVYGSFSQLKDLQLVRNACAHKNVETLQTLMPLASRYSFGVPERATQVAWAKALGSNDFAIEQWLFEMNLIADHATSSS
ncbi:hypothetical protein LWU68_00215 [Enterobacter cloacae]|uniref:hypothetical protein n=1 Tax=Enterobacter cloacae TaxID=550 RepID=UPI001E4D77AD|nr:hypothetical protein [Enterobacter cloacae]MCE1395335.1 hypothetical protein [Enterobacter cloacae]